MEAPLNSTIWAPYTYYQSTPISYSRDPEDRLLSGEWNPIQNSPQQILILCQFKGSLTNRATNAPGLLGALAKPLVPLFLFH